MKYSYYLPLLLILMVMCGCVRNQKKKDTQKEVNVQNAANKEYLHLNNDKPAGILRVECEDCILKFKIGNQAHTLEVRNGNREKFIYPSADSYLNTILTSHQDQMIRIIVFDPNGNIISNTLDHFKKKESLSRNYHLKYVKKSNSVLIKTYVKD